MVTMGLDLSINSTGVCINTDSYNHYYIITSKKSKSHPSLPSNVEYKYYDKPSPSKEYSENERIKAKNLVQIIDIIEDLIHLHSPDIIRVEGFSYGSVNSSRSEFELAGLNYLVRYFAEKLEIPYEIVTPSALKKFAVGNGSVKKDVLIMTFCTMFPEFKEVIKKGVKLDDIVDAFFLTIFQYN